MTTLRQAEVEVRGGGHTPQVCKTRGGNEQTDDRWRKEYGGLKRDQAKRLKELERENARVQKFVADRRACRVIGQARSTYRHRG